MTEPISFAERRKRLLEEREGRTPTAPPKVTPPPLGDSKPMPEFSAELIPDVEEYQLTDADKQLDSFVDRINIVAAYNKWCGKSVPEIGKKREGIMVSCPMPDHPDKNPSAWLNLDKNTWYCAACSTGGDQHDLAAIRYNYPNPGYKKGKLFNELRKQMASDFGLRTIKVPGGTVTYEEDSEPALSASSDEGESVGTDASTVHLVEDNPKKHEVHKPSAAPIKSNPEHGGSSDASPLGDRGELGEANVSYIYPEVEEEHIEYPDIPWREVVTPQTFLWDYLEACTNDDSPEEFHFWHGLLALGHAVGRRVTLDDFNPVYGNFMLCLLGSTGTGKSRSRAWLDVVCRAALPYQEDGTETTGVKLVPIPGSGEYLVRQFVYEGRDPSDPKISLGNQPVNGIVDFDEFSSLISRASRMGSTIKQTLMGFADTKSSVKIGSLSHGDFIAERPFCSVTASTQPRAIRGMLDRTDVSSGFLNRWVFAGGVPKKREVIGGSHSDTTVDLDASITQLKKVKAWGAVERKITLTDDAVLMLIDFFEKEIFPMQHQEDSDLLKRLDLLFKKIILLFAINEKRIIIDTDIIDKAKQLYQYILKCYAILDKSIYLSVADEIAEVILTAVIKITVRTGRGATIREIQRSIARRKYTNQQVEQTLKTMVSLQMIELAPIEAGMKGRPTVRYRAVAE